MKPRRRKCDVWAEDWPGIVRLGAALAVVIFFATLFIPPSCS